ncbi:chromate transporter [Fretibacterium fastidiosum]|uniref:chromate transporter n=1 Tax=Fretibacterium fastidiosum TaxID=651822 RepID=UPI0002EA29F6|nr:chromate transporter [Fretibacterium fastidiosum]
MGPAGLLELYWSFVKIGFTSFGGFSMIPLISSEMSAHHWMTAEEISDLVAIAEMTPGPLGLNCATFAGMRAAWLPGAIAANLGALTPTFTLGAVAAIFFERFKSSRRLEQVMVGVRPACIGLIAGVALTLAMTNYAEGGAAHLPSLGLGALDSLLLMKFKVSIPKVIGLSAAMGVLLFGVLGL